MIRLIIINLIPLILFGCTNSNDSKKVVEPESSFILHANELNLLNDDSCFYQISFDTIRSVSQFHSLRNSFLDSGKNVTRKLCISFNFKEKDTGIAKTVIVNYNAVPAYSGSGMLRPDKYILFDIRDSAYLFSILGIVHAFDGATSNELHKYVKRFYLTATDTTGMKEKFIFMDFHADTVNYIERYLSQAVMGYILAQRELSLKIYKKELQFATRQELIALRTRLPFLFKLRYKPIVVKVTSSKPADSL